VIAPLVLCGLVDATTLIPRLKLEIRYATADNFTHQRLYARARCLLEDPVARRLADVQRELRARKLGLLVYDCYRPLAVQKKMWQLVPDERYVSDPAKGSRHNRGAAVDITLVDERGRALPMPSGYDDFSERAHRDWAGGDDARAKEARANRALLEDVMTRHGFVGLPTEWWHFDATEWQTYPILDEPL
jgi:D-alanyl-D-alanine dipeptidase